MLLYKGRTMKEKIIALISEYSTLLWSYAIVRVSLTLLITWLASKYIPILVGKYLPQYPQQQYFGQCYQKSCNTCNTELKLDGDTIYCPSCTN